MSLNYKNFHRKLDYEILASTRQWNVIKWDISQPVFIGALAYPASWINTFCYICMHPIFVSNNNIGKDHNMKPSNYDNSLFPRINSDLKLISLICKTYVNVSVSEKKFQFVGMELRVDS